MTKEGISHAIRSLPTFTANKNSPLGPDGIIDTTGNPDLLLAALASVNSLGRVVYLATQGQGSLVRLALQDQMINGVHLTGTLQGDADPKKSIPMLIQWYREGKLPLEKVERQFPADEFERAKEEMKNGSTIKPILIWP
jgi:Zn-dependent alcohol dehydrogenase